MAHKSITVEAWKLEDTKHFIKHFSLLEQCLVFFSTMA